MATIKISNLHPTGTELFSDSESYMNELDDGELVNVNGGFSTPICTVPISITIPVIPITTEYTITITTPRIPHN